MLRWLRNVQESLKQAIGESLDSATPIHRNTVVSQFTSVPINKSINGNTGPTTSFTCNPGHVSKFPHFPALTSLPSTLVFTQHVPTPQKLQERDAAQSSQKSCRNNKGHSSFCPQTTPRLGSSQGNPRKKHAKLKGGGGNDTRRRTRHD